MRHKFFSILFYRAKARGRNWSINTSPSFFKFHFNECQWHFPFLFRGNISLESIDFMSLLPAPLSTLALLFLPQVSDTPILSPLEDRVHNFPIPQPIPTPSESCLSVSRLLTLITYLFVHIYILFKLKIVFYLLYLLYVTIIDRIE